MTSMIWRVLFKALHKMLRLSAGILRAYLYIAYCAKIKKTKILQFQK